MEPYTTEPSFWTGPVLVTIEITVTLLIVVIGVILIRYKRKKGKSFEHPPLKDKKYSGQSIQEILETTQEKNSSGQKVVQLNGGSFSLDKELHISAPIQLKGEGLNKTKIISKGNQPAIQIENTKNCSIEGVRVEGAIRCANGELRLDNCHIVANKDGICIEALDGSSIIFSGMISGGQSGIAIRARGESQVILKPPYKVSGEDYVIVEPKSTITLEEQEKKEEKPS